MSEQTDNQTSARQYLLGVLPEDEVARLEESYFSDDALFEDIEIAEDELIDAYVRGQLSDRDRALFEKNVATSKRLSERVEVGKLLEEQTSARFAFSSASQAHVPWWSALFASLFNQGPALKAAAAAGILVVVLGIAGLMVEWVRLRNEAQRVAAERSELERKQKDLEREITGLRSNTNQLEAELQQTKAAKDQLSQELQSVKEQLGQSQQVRVPEIASIVLLSGLSRSPTDDPDLVVHPQQTVIKLELVLDFDEYSTYGVSIQSADGRELVSRKGRRPHGPASQRSMLIEFSPRVLPEGTYVVKVSGLTSSGNYEPVSGYRFRLSKK
ncbi:MAG TPA: hypothetical protein VGO68_06515 [Pyrinomonadaceae bacterium]|nr:hypothetical protein [Pyrinomonadaceae bacterium]